MQQQLYPPGGVQFFLSNIFDSVSGAAQFIVPDSVQLVHVAVKFPALWPAFRLNSVQVFKSVPVIVFTPSPPDIASVVGGKKGLGGKVVTKNEWVLQAEDDDDGLAVASAGDLILFNLSFQIPDINQVMPQYSSDLVLESPELSFEPLPLLAATGHVTTTVPDSNTLYPLFGGEIELQVNLDFGAPTAVTYTLVDVQPDPGSEIDISPDPFSSYIQEVNAPATIPLKFKVSPETSFGDYIFSLDQRAFDGHQNSNIQLNVNIAKPDFGL